MRQQQEKVPSGSVIIEVLFSHGVTFLLNFYHPVFTGRGYKISSSPVRRPPAEWSVITVITAHGILESGLPSV
jgi:hypothetical protein